MTEPRWHLWTDTVPGPGWRQMAVDQALLDLAEQSGAGFIRFYHWEPWCLSFGRHEPALGRYDRVRIEALGLSVVRRPTGGRAVWHARELTYAVAAPSAWVGGARAGFGRIHQAILEAVQDLGGDARLAPAARPVGPGGGPCFGTSTGGEIVVAGRKLVGGAQLTQGSAFLQHGSLLLQDDQQQLAAVSREPGGAGAITLREALGRLVPFDTVAAAVANRLRRWEGAWLEGRPASVDQTAAGHEARFRDPGWTWRR
mgnify:FL=1